MHKLQVATLACLGAIACSDRERAPESRPNAESAAAVDDRFDDRFEHTAERVAGRQLARVSRGMYELLSAHVLDPTKSPRIDRLIRDLMMVRCGLDDRDSHRQAIEWINSTRIEDLFPLHLLDQAQFVGCSHFILRSGRKVSGTLALPGY